MRDRDGAPPVAAHTTRREERRTAAREGILAAAHRQLAEHGLASASMAAVAARAGVATGTLYRHFPSHAELLAEVVGDALRAERALLARATAGLAPRAALTAWVRVSADRALQAPRLAHALLTEPAGPAVDAARRRARAGQEAALAELLDAGARSGAWPVAATELQATALVGAAQAAVVGPAAVARLERRPDAGADIDALVVLALGAVGARADVGTPS